MDYFSIQKESITETSGRYYTHTRKPFQKWDLMAFFAL